jgi:hypothetical protein
MKENKNELLYERQYFSSLEGLEEGKEGEEEDEDEEEEKKQLLAPITCKLTGVFPM